MVDYNADKEHGQGQVKWVVENANKALPVQSVQTSAGEIKLGKDGRALISEPSIAAEIRDSHRRDLSVSRIFTNHPSDRGHRYVFGGWPEMPWKKKAAQEADSESQGGT